MKKEILKLNLQCFAEDELGVEESDIAESEEEFTDENPVEEEVTEEAEESTTEDEPEPEQDFKNERNAIYADARRKAEANARMKYDSEIAELCKGYVHPITKQPIRTLAEYKDALYQQERLATESKLQESGLDPKLIENAVANNPMIREAQMVLESNRAQQAERALESEFLEIQKLDPSITSYAEIPNVDEVISMVQRGARLIDAYKIVNFDSLMNARSAGAKQSAINQIKGKSHLVGVDSLAQDTSSEEIPADVYKAYKEIYPDKSGAELKKLYNSTLKKLGGK